MSSFIRLFCHPTVHSSTFKPFNLFLINIFLGWVPSFCCYFPLSLRLAFISSDDTLILFRPCYSQFDSLFVIIGLDLLTYVMSLLQMIIRGCLLIYTWNLKPTYIVSDTLILFRLYYSRLDSLFVIIGLDLLTYVLLLLQMIIRSCLFIYIWFLILCRLCYSSLVCFAAGYYWFRFVFGLDLDETMICHSVLLQKIVWAYLFVSLASVSGYIDSFIINANTN